MPQPIKAITLEEHISFPIPGDQSPFYDVIWQVFPQRLEVLRDASELRLADMDAGNVSLQIMSYLPGIAVSNPSGCRAANDEFVRLVQQHPDRYRAFAVLPMAHPEEAARELERAVKDLGLLGALVDNHLRDGTHYDDEKFWPVFAMAEKLDVPIYLHPAPPIESDMKSRFNGNYSVPVAMGLATGAWGWHENVGLHVLKLYAAGLFERHPNLKIIIGHMGELMPCMIDRVERLEFFKKMAATRNKSMRKVWAENIWITTSGIFSPNPLATILKTTPVEHIMYSVDYPFESNVTGREFLEQLADSDVLTREESEMIAYKNAEKLFKL
ncbi:2-amino-3-carboxymuconate-6-semialdehyde decarboxylase [Xylariaceae sp. FL0255]|nr:2-amino-3-carboxymuconate-6-semialdehyde decarboxylase [Xylariaceae sp. FL0255]